MRAYAHTRIPDHDLLDCTGVGSDVFTRIGAYPLFLVTLKLVVASLVETKIFLKNFFFTSFPSETFVLPTERRLSFFFLSLSFSKRTI